MNEKEWVDKIKKECILNLGNFDVRYAFIGFTSDSDLVSQISANPFG